MPTQNADKIINHNISSRRSHIKRLFVLLSTAPVPEPKPTAFSKPKKPSYLRYIEYV